MIKHQFKGLTNDQYEELFSNYLIDSWSFSKVNTFSRNEKAFEMQYIYRKFGKRSATEVAGSAYHDALKFYFTEFKDGVLTDLVALERVAFDYIDNVEPSQWKQQKTTPTIADCILKANKTVTAALNNFLSEISVYTSEIKEIIYVEEYFDEFLTVNGVDIPLPCHAMLDLGFKSIDGKIIIVDHKSKSIFTDEKDLKFSIGKQGITYVKCFEAKTGLTVDEIWFVENKISKNQDKSPQLSCFKMTIDIDTRRLYEAMLYEPLKRMLDAVSNPDYIYLINEADNYVDKAEMYEFWAMTMIAEVNDFNVPENKKQLISNRLKKIRDASLASINPKILSKFREGAANFIQYDLTNKDMDSEQKIEHVLRSLGLVVSVAHVFKGFSSDTFLVEVSAGTSISSVFKYKMDIASALNVTSIRIMKDLFIHEGKSYVAIESGKARETDLLFDPAAIEGLRIPIGVDNFNRKIVWDLNNPSTPHALICGSTGSGKSVCIISIIEYAKLMGIKNIVLFDPKFEFTKYKSANVLVYNDIADIEKKMKELTKQMNDLIKAGGEPEITLVIFDEFADATSMARSGNELFTYADVVVGNYKDGSPKVQRQKVGEDKALEENLRVILQKGRSCGFRVVAATQRASAKVITGDAKVNFPVQICFKVPKEVDSKVVLDEAGAESLGGKGDGLMKSPEYGQIVRLQAYYFKN